MEIPHIRSGLRIASLFTFYFLLFTFYLKNNTPSHKKFAMKHSHPMKNTETSRRDFLKKAAFATAGAMVLPAILPSCSKGANDRIHIAHLGTGGRGTSVARNYFLPIPGARSLATCDAYSSRRENLALEISAYYKEQYNEEINCIPYADYEEILERRDIDAVHITTPDHWHLPMAIKAARAGKHIYLDKPLGLSLDNMIALEKLMKREGLVFHYGTQQRSLEHMIKGIDMVRSGKIGDIYKIEIWAPPGGAVEPEGSVISAGPPDDLDYDRWLGPAPVKPYSEARVASTGAYHIYDYAIGFIAGWGAHPLDIAIWGAKEHMSDTGTFTGSGVLFPEDMLFDTINYWDIEIAYNNGLQVHFVSTNHAAQMMEKLPDGNGTTFYGTKGWISLGRGAAAASIPELHEELNVRVYGENNMHGFNFIKAIRGETEEISPLDDAILSDCISHMGNILIRSGKEKITWDPVRREITDYPELTAMHFHRKPRAPYTV